MPNYRRYPAPGHSIFITLVTADRTPLLVAQHDLLRQAFLAVKRRHPFHVPAIVVMPDHCHFIMELPMDEVDFSTRIGLIKSTFSRALPRTEAILTESRTKRRERGIWQRRFWEHTLRDNLDFDRHFDYIHWNPVKHGYATRCLDWEFSSFHRHVEQGVYPPDWGTVMPPSIADLAAGE